MLVIETFIIKMVFYHLHDIGEPPPPPKKKAINFTVPDCSRGMNYSFTIKNSHFKKNGYTY